MTIRRIEPLPLPDSVTPQQPATKMPTVKMVGTDQLRVDDAYQRGLSRKSIELIHKIVSGFDWRKFKPPVVTLASDADGPCAVYDVIDGQHTAIAVASHGGIEQIPVVVIETTGSEDKARSFLGHNRDRLAMSANQLHFSALAAGDEEAITIDQVCNRAGVTILRLAPTQGVFYRGQTLAIGAITTLIRKRFSTKARHVLELCVKSGAAPISADMIKAVDAILHEKEYSGEVAPEDLLTVLIKLPQLQGKITETMVARQLPKWRAMTVILFQNCRKTRRKA